MKNFRRIFRPLLSISICVAFTMLAFTGCYKETVELGAEIQYAEGVVLKTFTSDITEIDFGTNGRGMVIYNSGKRIYRTSDYGETWTSCTTFTASACYVDQLHYANGSVPYFVYHASSSSSTPHVYCSVNGGTSWFDNFTMAGSQVCLAFYNSSSGYAYARIPSYNYGIVQTTDFADNYTYLGTAPSIGPIMQFTSATTGYAMTNTDDFAVTGNGGITWTTRFNNCRYFTRMSATGECYLIANDHRIFKTTDFGITWNLAFSDPGGNYYEEIDFSDQGLVVAAAQGYLLCSRDYGATWKYLKLSGEGTTLSHVVVLDNNTVIGTAGKSIFKYIIPEVL